MADYNLPLAASKVKAARSNFAYIQGKKSNQVYIAPGAVGAKQLAELEAECEKPKILFKGVCFLEDEQLIFATKAKPSMTWEVMTTKVFVEKKARKYLPVVFRQLGENESDQVAPAGEEGGETTPTEAAPAAEAVTEKEPEPATTEEKSEADGPAATEEKSAAPTGDLRAQWFKLKGEVGPRANVVIRSYPPNASELLTILRKGLDAEKAEKWGDAIVAFKELASKLPPPPPPAPPGGKVMSAKELEAEMKKNLPRLQQVVAANPGRKAALQAPAAAFQAALRSGNLAAAQAALNDMLALVKVLGAGGPPEPPAAPGKTPAAEAEEIDPAEEKAFKDTWKKATGVWLECVETVDGQIEKLRKSMQGSDDPDFLEIAEKGLTVLTENHKTPVMVALREVDGAGSDKREAAVAKARAAIQKFRSHIVSDERVAVCDQECETEFGVKLTIRDEITRGLDELEMALEEAPV